jgi:hypothetical protein
VNKTFFVPGIFCPPGTSLGWSYLHGEEYGVSICRVVTNFEIAALGVSKLQKTIPQNVELPATLCRSVA